MDNTNTENRTLKSENSGTATPALPTPFTTRLANEKELATIKHGGGSAGIHLCMPQIADHFFNTKIKGTDLFLYLFRRFGYHNYACDDYKQLCQYILITPNKKLFLGINPCLSGENLHFHFYTTKGLYKQILNPPGTDLHWKRKRCAIHKWWNQTGSKIYSIGACYKSEKDEELVYLIGEDAKAQYGIWKHKDDHPAYAKKLKYPMGIVSFLIDKHPEATLPPITTEEKQLDNDFFEKFLQAPILATFEDLLTTTNIRDINFNILGSDACGEEIPKDNGRAAEYFPHTAIKPKAYFRKAAPNE